MGSVIASFLPRCVMSRHFLWEFLVLIMPQIWVFLFPDWALPILGCGTLLIIFLCWFRPASGRIASDPLVFFSLSRAAIMIMCVIGILAVDFQAFPRRFVKTETMGTSLMDIGVGIVTVSLGLSAARHYQNDASFPSMVTAVRSTAVTLLIGLARMVLVKGVDYQEHVSEYGVHWNFFVTLGMLPIMVALLFRLFRSRHAFLLGLAIASLYQAALSFTNLQSWLLFSSDRSNLIAQNREGLFSLFGYLAITLMSLRFGRRIFSTPPMEATAWRKVLREWMGISGLLWTMLGFLLKVCGLEVSRRLANLPFCIWSLAVAISWLTAALALDIFLRPQLSIIAEAVSRNQLPFFLLANLLTGAINLAMQTLLASTLTAVLILTAYMLFSLGLMVVLCRNKIFLRL